MTKILLIDDDPLIRRLYLKALQFSGFETKIASDGELGITMARTYLPDLILLDIMLPKKNGFEVLRELKIDPQTASIPVIILSNLSHESDAETALDSGAINYLIKSDHEPNEVVQLIQKTLSIS